jgi:hypothetical protein
MARTRRSSALTAGLLVAGLLTACAGAPIAFNRDDNLGWTACRDLYASRLVDDGDRRELLLVNAAASAAAADSPEIRATVDPPVDEDNLERTGSEDRGTYTVDEDELATACEEKGFTEDEVRVE